MLDNYFLWFEVLVNFKTSTTSCCPECKEIIPAEKMVEGNLVYMQRYCHTHGDFKTLISKDSQRFFDQTFTSEGKKRYENQTSEDKGCPSDCGLCPNHKQHICSALIEITGQCNLRCPVCYFADYDQKDISLKEFKSRLQTLLRTENGKLDVLQLSGGEPTLHKDFITILEYACTQNINRIVINTNGLILLENEEIYNALKKRRDKVEVYLQFDGFNPEINISLRGTDLKDKTLKLIEKLDSHEIKIGLASTIVLGNLSEIGNILDLARRVPNISGITFQRFTRVGVGEHISIEPVFAEDILQSIAGTGIVQYKDIVPLPCSHENCTSLAFLFVYKGKIHSLSEFIDYKKNQNIIKNKIGFDATQLDLLKEALASKKACCSWITNQIPVVKKLREFTEGKASAYKDMKILKIAVKNFMDASTFDSDRARKCCVGVSVGNDKIIPFCVHNIFSRKNNAF